MSGCISCMHKYTYAQTPFWPSADNAIGGTLWRTESHSKNSEGNSPRRNKICPAISSPTQFSVWLKTQRGKKSSNTWQERSFSPCNTATPSLTLPQTFVFVTVSTMKSSELSHWLLGCTAETAISRSSNWITKKDPLNSSWDVVLSFCLNTHMN